MQVAHAFEQLAHIFRARAGSGLIGHAGQPFDQVIFKEAAERHQHQRNGAVAADEVFFAVADGLVDDAAVHRVKDDDGAVVHAQGGGGVNPVAVPAARAQLRVDGLAVVATLAGDDDVHRRERIEMVRVLQGLAAAGEGRRRFARLRGGKEGGFNVGEVLLFLHPPDEDGANHAAPANNAKFFHVYSSVKWKGTAIKRPLPDGCKRAGERLRPARSVRRKIFPHARLC